MTYRPSDIDMVDAYIEHGSVRAAGVALGMPSQTLHRRLVKIGAVVKPIRVLSDADRARMIAYYTETPDADFSLEALAKELGRTRAYICGKAKALGLTRQTRTNSAEHVAKQSRPRWHDRQHPRGALGLKHTDATKAKVSAASKLSWVTQRTFGTGNMTDDARQRRSDLTSARNASTSAENAYSRARKGRRADLNDMFFRSAWEANYARYLNWLQARGDIDRWEYEPETFWFLTIKRGVRSYKPDFRIWEKGGSYLVEVKGWMDPKSMTKLKRMKKYYPHERIDLVGAKQYADLKSKLSRIIPGWESA